MGGNAVVEPRERIVRAAHKLLTTAGPDAVSTRSVSAAADVQPPTIYRHFGDMRHLLEAAASRGMADYMRRKRKNALTDDPVEDLRRGWEMHVDFALTDPYVYTVLYGRPPSLDSRLEGVIEGHAMLTRLVQRIAEAGLLRVTVERGADMMHAACRGTALSLLLSPPEERDPGLSHATREAMLAAIVTSTDANPDDDVSCHAIALRALLAKEPSASLSSNEVAMLTEWLGRLTDADGKAGSLDLGPRRRRARPAR